MSGHKKQLGSLGIVGVGLIGGSIGLAAKNRGLCEHVVGIGRNADRLRTAKSGGVIDEFHTDMEGLRDTDLVVVCTPVDRIAEDVLSVLSVTNENCLVTDAGSVKTNVCRTLQGNNDADSRFVGSHPLAGSHQSGFESAHADLYQGRRCVVTPTETTKESLVESIEEFWVGLGMDVHSISPEEHDRVLAVTSHLPHLGAAAIAGLIDDLSVNFAATGFRDTTRVAAGDPALWTAIFSDNAEQVVAATDELIAVLTRYRNAISGGDRDALQALLAHGQQQRLMFDDRHPS